MVDVSAKLDDREARKLAALLETDPDVALRTCKIGLDQVAGHLEVLEHFLRLQRLKVDDQRIQGVEGLRHTPDLRALELTDPGKLTFALGPLRGLAQLEFLSVEKAGKELDVLAELPCLRDLA